MENALNLERFRRQFEVSQESQPLEVNAVLRDEGSDPKGAVHSLSARSVSTALTPSQESQPLPADVVQIIVPMEHYRELLMRIAELEAAELSRLTSELQGIAGGLAMVDGALEKLDIWAADGVLKRVIRAVDALLPTPPDTTKER